MEDLRNISEIYGLQVINTTSARNGYPSHLQDAIIGFDNFEQAEEIARKEGLTLIWVDRRDGWQLWHRGKEAICPMNTEVEDYGDDYFFYESVKEVIEDEKEVISALVEDEADYTKIDEAIERYGSLIEEAAKLKKGQVVVAHSGYYYDTIYTTDINWSHDTKHYTLAAIDCDFE